MSRGRPGPDYVRAIRAHLATAAPQTATGWPASPTRGLGARCGSSTRMSLPTGRWPPWLRRPECPASPSPSNSRRASVSRHSVIRRAIFARQGSPQRMPDHVRTRGYQNRRDQVGASIASGLEPPQIADAMWSWCETGFTNDLKATIDMRILPNGWGIQGRIDGRCGGRRRLEDGKAAGALFRLLRPRE